jgi:hypothetical protein
MAGSYGRIDATARRNRNDCALAGPAVPQSHPHAAVIEPKRAQVLPSRRTSFGKAGPEVISGFKPEKAIGARGLILKRCG